MYMVAMQKSQDDKKTNKPAPPAKPKTAAQTKADNDGVDKKKTDAAGKALTAGQNNTTTITIK
jgi:hypothetical protein